MTDPINSALFVDYDSLRQSLARTGGEAAARLAMRTPALVAALEAGELLNPLGTTRTLAARRCYATPASAGTAAGQLASAGFQLVECPANGDGTRGASLNIAMDAVAALTDPAGFGEYIVLSADPALAPLLARLKAGGHRVAVYADGVTAPGYRALADAVLEATALTDFLLTRDAAEAAGGLDRAELEAFARKMHAATNIPLFSPKTFAELFRFLATEIATNGYHFQTTAKNVADRLVETGRSVTRRQVVFIVKGLALKGHVFSSDDTPRRLAEAFREQAHYLIGSAGMTLDEPQERLLTAWLVDRVPAGPAAPATSGQPAAPPAPAATAQAPLAAAHAPGADEPAPSQGEPAPATAAEAEAKSPAKPAKVPLEPAETAPAKAPGGKAAPSAPAATQPPGATNKPAGEKPSRPMITPDDARAAIAARVAASGRGKTESRPSHPPQSESPPTFPAAEPASSESIESSILAAIAEAVDVLVEDGGKPQRPSASAKKQPVTAQPAAPAKTRSRAKPEPEPEPVGDGDDIGNEIQRIIATYNRTRRETPRK